VKGQRHDKGKEIKESVKESKGEIGLKESQGEIGKEEVKERF